MRWREILRHNWGLLIYAVSIVGALVQLSNERHWAHYRIFSRAAGSLWAGADPYYDTFGAGSGYWYYSPSCGLFYYGLFSWLPEMAGLYAYMISSILILTVGIVAFLRACGLDPFDRAESRWMNVTWFWVSFELNPGILSTKTEITMVGLTFLAAAALLSGRRLAFGASALAMIVNWKFQPLPIVGLLFLLLLACRRRLRFIPAFFAGLAVWFALPGLVLGWARLSELQARWLSSIGSAIEATWREFMHIYRFLDAVVGLPVTYAWIAPIALFGALSLAAIVLVWSARSLRAAGADATLADGIPLVLALGSTFAVVFSPYGQSNAFILYAPVLLTAVLFAREAAREGRFGRCRLAMRLIFVSAFITSVLHSDVVTKPGRVFFGTLGLKPIGSLFLAALVVWLAFTRLGRYSSGSR